jgi:hypothetical protein
LQSKEQTMKVTAEGFNTFLEEATLIPPSRDNDNNEGNTNATTNVERNKNNLEPRRIASELIIFYQTQQIERLRDENNNLVVQGIVVEAMLEVLAENLNELHGINQTQRNTIDDQQGTIQLQRNIIDRQTAITNGDKTIINKQEQMIESGKQIINKQDQFIENDQFIINKQKQLIELYENKSHAQWKFIGILCIVICFQKFLRGQ